MRPVPPWLTQVTGLEPGEAYLDFWGPMRTWVNGFELTGYLVLSTHRFSFVRSYGPGPAYMAVQFSMPLASVMQATAQWQGEEVYVGVNHLVFHGVTPSDGHASATAQEIRNAILYARQQRMMQIHSAPLPSSHPGPPGGAPAPPPPPPHMPVACRNCRSPIPQGSRFCPVCGMAQAP